MKFDTTINIFLYFTIYLNLFTLISSELNAFITGVYLCICCLQLFLYRRNKTLAYPKFPSDFKIILGINSFVILYIALQALNYRSVFNQNLKVFNYRKSFLDWLPNTIDLETTIKGLIEVSQLSLIFWVIVVAFLISSNRERLYKQHLLGVISVGLLISLWGLLDRFVNGFESIHEYKISSGEFASFGLFGYRGNAAAFLLILFPLSFVLLIDNYNNSYGKRKNDFWIFLLLITSIIYTALVFTYSRLGICISLLCISYIILKYHDNIKVKYKKVICILVFFFVTGLFFVVKENLITRFSFHSQYVSIPDNKLESNYQFNVVFNDELTNLPQNLKLLEITDSKNPKYRNQSISVVLKKADMLTLIFSQDSRNTERKIPLKARNIGIVLPKLGINVHENNVSINIDNSQSELVTQENGDLFSFNQEPKFLFICNNPRPNGFRPIKSVILNNTFSTTNKKSPSVIEWYQNKFNFIKFKALFGGRLDLYMQAISMLKDNYLLGCGFDTWSLLYLNYRHPEDVWAAWAHNDILEFITTIGIIPTILGVFCIYLILSKNNNISDNQTVHPISGFKIGIATCLLFALFDFPLHTWNIRLFFVTCAGIIYGFNIKTYKKIEHRNMKMKSNY